MRQYENSNVSDRLQNDFIIENNKVEVKRRRALILMEQEGLSDVEDLGPKERKTLNMVL